MANQPVVIQETFARNVVRAFRTGGEAWLRTLPALIAELTRDWDITVGPPFDLSFNYVAPARRADGTAAVLKAGVEDDEVLREIRALRRYGGDGMCRLLEADEGRCAMLLERVRPGDTLVELARSNDDAATRIAAGVMRRLWHQVSPDEGFLPVAAWFDAAFRRHRAEYGGPGPFPGAIFQRAEAVVPELLDSTPEIVLLHGDFHHYNVLSAEREPWLAIDPKGVCGDRGFDVGQFLLNPDLGGDEVRPAVARRRLAIFAEELQYDHARLRDWAVAENVLSACWSAEDGGNGWQKAIRSAEALLGR